MSLIDGSLNRRETLSLWGKRGGGGYGGNGLRGLTLDDVLGTEGKPVPATLPPPNTVQVSRTLLDVIKEDPSGGPLTDLVAHHGDKKTWKAFKDKLKGKRAGATWTSSIYTPTSDLTIIHPVCTPPNSQHNSVGFESGDPVTHLDESTQDSHSEIAMAEAMNSGDHELDRDTSCNRSARPMMVRRSSSRIGSLGPAVDITEPGDSAGNASVQSLRQQFSRHNSTRRASTRAESGRFLARSESSMVKREDPSSDPDFGDEPTRSCRRVTIMGVGEERQLSAREAAAAQEAAEAAAAAAAAAAEADEEGSDKEEEEEESGGEDAQPVRMSLMDLLEETDRQMGLEGSRYVMSDEEEEDEDDVEEEDDEEDGDGGDHTCCVCMVKHKGSAFIPCGHTFCRMCTRELTVSRGNCPVCNSFVLEILDIF